MGIGFLDKILMRTHPVPPHPTPTARHRHNMRLPLSGMCKLFIFQKSAQLPVS